MVKQGNLGIPLPPNSLDLHQTQNQKRKSWTDLCAHFTPLKLSKRSQIPHPSTRTASTPPKNENQQHINTTHTKFYHFICHRSEEKFSDTWGDKRKS